MAKAPPAKAGPRLDSRPTKSVLSSTGGRPPAFYFAARETTLGQLVELKGHGYADAKARNDPELDL